MTQGVPVMASPRDLPYNAGVAILFEVDAMHRIECPSCHQWLRLPRQVHNARLKCSRCGHIFVGSSRDDIPRPEPRETPVEVQEQTPSEVTADFDAPVVLDAPAAAAPAAGVSSPQPVRIVMAPRPRKSTLPAVITIVAGALLIVVLALLVYGATHKHVILKDVGGRVILDQWLANEEAARVKEEHEKKPAEKKSGGGALGIGDTVSKTSETPLAGGGSVSEGGLVGAAQVTGDTQFALENMRIIPDDVGEGGMYCGVVWSKHDTVVEKAMLTLKVGQTNLTPVTLQWLAPGGRVPFTAPFSSLDAQQRMQAPRGAFSGVVIRKDLDGWDIPPGEPSDNVSDDKTTITITGIATNLASGSIRGARMHADFLTDQGVVQGSVLGELKVADLGPAAKSDYTVTYKPALVGQPHKYFLRVIGTKVP
jgi:hypothetical protein